MNWILLSCLLSADPHIIWYSPETLPECYESSGNLYALDYNLAGSLDRTGSANNEKPWRHTGGLDDCNIQIKRCLKIPAGTWIELRTEQRRVTSGKIRKLPYSVIVGDYPVGTVAEEYLYENNALFEIRTRIKTADGWQASLQEFGAKPIGYNAVNDCKSCHEDIGKHSFELDGNRDWYGTIRGLEPHGPIHWHPWVTDNLGGSGIRPVIRREVQHFVRWKQ